MERKTPWTEQDLIELKRASESARLEFKESRLLEQPKEKIAEILSKEVSAFANSEGGDIVIGMREKKAGNTKVADDIDEGVDPDKVPREWLQQIVESNVSPYLLNIRFHTILLSGTRAGRIAFVISVPPGSTAYQASDKRYYSRSEFECKAMPDHEIRLRMMRGRVAQASLEIMDCEVLTADEEFARRVRQIQDEIQDRKAFVGRNTKGDEELGEHVKNIQKRIRDEMEHDGASDLISKKQRLPLGEPQTETQKRQMLKWQIQGQLEEQARLENKLEAELKSKRPFDEYSFRSIVTNTGEISVRDFLLSVVKSTELEVLPPSGFLSVSNSEFSYRYAGGPSKVTRPKETSPSVEYSLPEKKLFPGDQLSFPDRWRIRLPQGLSISQANATLRWTIYLDDSPPVRGEINLAKQFET